MERPLFKMVDRTAGIAVFLLAAFILYAVILHDHEPSPVCDGDYCAETEAALRTLRKADADRNR
ncbi:MAG: hypothetical protein ABW189_06535 [Rickettsiales bacterium]